MSEQNATPPGWYYAAGDPPGTQRYWDGATWQGGPQPVAGGAGEVGTLGGRTPAAIGPRVIAVLIDGGLTLVGSIAAIIAGAVFGTLSDTLGGLIGFIGLLAVLGFGIWNTYVRQGQTGQSIGKQQQNIALLGIDGMPMGGVRVFVRYLVGSAIDALCYANTLSALIKADNRKFADGWLDCHVYDAEATSA